MKRVNVVVRNVSNVALLLGKLNFLKIVRATTPFSVTPCHVKEVVKVITKRSRGELFLWDKTATDSSHTNVKCHHDSFCKLEVRLVILRKHTLCHGSAFL